MLQCAYTRLGESARDSLTVASETGGSLLGINMTYPKVESIFELLDKWRHLPAYQLERRADIFFALFLPDVLNHHLRKRKRGIEIDRRLIPEFPLKRPGPKNNRSKKADYLALSTDRKHAFLIELKTDRASLDKKQLCYLKGAVCRGMHELLCGLKCIVRAPSIVKNTKDAAKKRRKYFHLLKALNDLRLVRLPPSLKEMIFSPSREPFKPELYKSIVEKIEIVDPAPDSLEIIYVLPYVLSTAATADFESIDFRIFAETVKDRGEIGRVFADSLQSWAEIEAGSLL